MASGDDWSVMIEEQVYETDLDTLLQWIGDGRVQRNHLVKRGSLNWVEARLAPQLRQHFPPVGESSAAEPQEAIAQKDGVDKEKDESRSVSPATTEVGFSSAGRPARYLYCVLPFEGNLRSGQYVEEVSRQLADLINQQSLEGWEFDSVNSVHIRVNPGCLAGLFLSGVSYVTRDQVVFRKEK